ncbi:MAG TPA: DUF4097 family beta strand repeat-containing protein [Gemmatimonadales bacterium]|nr:DUF4097 family beta strand repeat-containing protein [Gemmatimonadales bacterium]
MTRALALLFLAAQSLAAQEPVRQAIPFTVREPVASGAWVRVYSTNGDVRVLAALGSDAEIRGEPAPHSGGRGRELQYEVLRDGGDLIVCVLEEYQTCSRTGVSGRSRGRRSRGDSPSASITVRIPRGVKLAASSGNGEVRVTGATSEVDVSSGNGDVSVEGAGDRVTANSGNGDIRVTTARGPVSAGTGNGEVWVRMDALGASAPMDFTSGNGSVTVLLPAAFEGDIEIMTGNGEFESDFPITTQGRFSTHRLAGRIGKGGPHLRLRTGNGDIELRRVTASR